MFLCHDLIPVHRLITGVDHPIEEEDDVEEMYTIVSDIKPPEWEDIPASHLPLHELLLDIPTTYEQAINSPQASEWISACKSEFESMLQNKVFVWAQLPISETQAHTPLPSKWLFVVKVKLDGLIEKYKARIVAGGHKQKEGIDFHETYAPVAKFGSLRILLTMVALDDLEGEQCDIVTAFLYGELDKEVYMHSPSGITSKIGDLYISETGDQLQITENTPPLYWHLLKSLYGLRQSPRYFYKNVTSKHRHP